ncbi:hypothetical protein Tsubulata_046461 [Turnera subulata]|uniref:Uncharacterized protein n=1 Tax=Turnera subulata TaxID=218843 RepID=A0A9Q0FS04_9ROSI|nr:hypothetical protein Tsubulata_046461 [Turnera subulata]
MESSQIFGVSEECQSCESGWTMYLSSPVHGDDGDDYSDGGDHNSVRHGKNYNHEDDSDDSMASDASSGPSHLGVSHFNQDGNQLVGGYCLEVKAKKTIEKKNAGMRRKEEKEEKAFKAKGATAPAQSTASKGFVMAENVDDRMMMRRKVARLQLTIIYVMYFQTFEYIDQDPYRPMNYISFRTQKGLRSQAG